MCDGYERICMIIMIIHPKGPRVWEIPPFKKWLKQSIIMSSSEDCLAGSFLPFSG